MNWGDLNGDGRSDYVDQKIFDTQINPYSGEYEGPFQPRQDYGSNTKVPGMTFGDFMHAMPFALIIVLLVCALTALDVDLDLLYVIGLGQFIIFIIVLLIIRSSINKKYANKPIEAQNRRAKRARVFWIIVMIISVCLFIAAFVLSSQKASFMAANIDPYLGKVGKTITRQRWDMLWDEYYAIERWQVILAYASICIGIDGAIGYLLAPKIKEQES